MKQVKDMPKTGQFIVVSDYNEEQWASTYKWIDGKLHVLSWNNDCEEFISFNYDLEQLISNNIKYFVFDGEK